MKSHTADNVQLFRQHHPFDLSGEDQAVEAVLRSEQDVRDGKILRGNLRNLMNLLFWDLYEIHSSSSLQGIMLRGRLRKFANQRGVNFLVENDEAGEIVRFAILAQSDPAPIIACVQSIVPNAQVTRIQEDVANPVLSKLKVNFDERYLIEDLASP